MKIRLSPIAAILASPAAFAGGTWSNVTVLHEQECTSECSSPNGFAKFELSAASTGGPSCATYKNWVAVDITTPGGEAAAALLHYARISGAKLVSVLGTGACTVSSSNETLSLVNY